MPWSSGETINTSTRLRRLSGAIPTSYTIFVYDDTYYAECNIPGGTEYSGNNKSTVIQNAVDALSGVGGLICLKPSLSGGLESSIVLDEDNHGTYLVGEGSPRDDTLATYFTPPADDYAFKIEGSANDYAHRVHQGGISNIGIRDDRASVAHGVKVKYADGVLLENIFMWKLKGYALYIEEVRESYFNRIDNRYCGDVSNTRSSVEVLGSGYCNNLMFQQLWVTQPYYYGFKLDSTSGSSRIHNVSVSQGLMHGSDSAGIYGMTSDYDGFRILGPDVFKLHQVNMGAFNDGYLVYIAAGSGGMTGGHAEISGCSTFSTNEGVYTNGSQVSIHDTYFYGINKKCIYTSGNECKIHHNWFQDVCLGTDDTYSVVTLNSDYNLVDHNFFYNAMSNKPKYAIEITAVGNYNRVHENNLYSGKTAKVLDSGSNNFVQRNNGYVTENSGSDSIASGSTSKVVAHGLDVTPSAEHFTITGKENPTNDVGTIWIDSIGATNFTVNVENDPGASNWDFGWKVIVI